MTDTQGLESLPDLKWPSGSPDQIEQEIISAVAEIPDQEKNWIDKRPLTARLRDRLYSLNVEYMREKAIEELWANEIASRIATLGRRLRYDVLEPNSHWRYADWMYGVIWRDGEEQVRNYSLVLEFSWPYETSPSEFAAISYDSVGKLLLARADHRVLVCQGYDPDRTFQDLATMVQTSEITRPGDRYLLLYLNRTHKKFGASVYVAGSSRTID